MLDKDTVDNILDDIIAEVNSQYYIAVRKSILDYVLKD